MVPCMFHLSYKDHHALYSLTMTKDPDRPLTPGQNWFLDYPFLSHPFKYTPHARAIHIRLKLNATSIFFNLSDLKFKPLEVI